MVTKRPYRVVYKHACFNIKVNETHKNRTCVKGRSDKVVRSFEKKNKIKY